mgnify:CR=1 FL=1
MLQYSSKIIKIYQHRSKIGEIGRRLSKIIEIVREHVSGGKVSNNEDYQNLSTLIEDYRKL